MLDKTCFVTGADSNYFWLVSAAVFSLREKAPGLDIRVMDFGFTPAQQRFFQDQNCLLARPFELPAGLHPYTLKTCFGLYVRELSKPNFVWFDSDMLCVDASITAIDAIINQMHASGTKVAACPDMGPNPTLAQFASAFKAPALGRFVEKNAAHAASPYLNTGFIVFAAATEFLAQWPRLAAQIQGEVCLDQNAFNILYYRDPAQGQHLDPRRWNVHSNLLVDVSPDGQSLSCQGQRVNLLHCTSNRNVHHEELTISLKLAGNTIPARFKTFRNPDLRHRHLETLHRFLKQNATALRDAGVV